MESKQLFSIIFTLFFLKSFSQKHIYIDTLKIHQQIKSYGLNEDLLNFKHDFFKSILFKNDSTLIYNPNGTLHLFEIKLDTTHTVLKLSNGEFHGHNFKRSIFIHNDVIYSYGGEGLFNFSTKLIYFDSELKGWFEKKIQNYPFDTRKVVNSWKYGNKIMVLLNHYSSYDNNSNYKYTQYSFGEIDLTNFKYKTKFEFESNDDYGLSFSKGDYLYESDRYLLVGHKTDYENCKVEIFNKKTGDLIKTNIFENLQFPDGNNLIYIEDSIIYYKNNLGIVDSVDMNLMNITKKKNFIQYYNSKKKSKIKYLLISLVLTIPIILLIFIYRKRKPTIENEENKSIIEIEGRLQEYINKRISRDELDDILRISHYSFETIKKRRSFLIIQINERNVLIVERIRKQDDKRYFEYKITKS